MSVSNSNVNINVDVHDRWVTLRDKFLEKGGTLMVLGGVDTGKSTFCRWLCSELTQNGVKVGMIDCDVGQSDIGPPSCFGCKIVSEIPYKGWDRIHFIGSFSPYGRIAQGIMGLVKMIKYVKWQKVQHIIINTTGWTDGDKATFYKQSKIDIAFPSFIAVFQREREIYHMLRPYRRMPTIHIMYIPVSPAVKIKTQEERRTIRVSKFINYFASTTLVSFRVDKIGISGVKYPITSEKVEDQVVALVDNYGNHIFLGVVKKFTIDNLTLEIATPFEGDVKKIRRIHFENMLMSSVTKEYISSSEITPS